MRFMTKSIFHRTNQNYDVFWFTILLFYMPTAVIVIIQPRVNIMCQNVSKQVIVTESTKVSDND